MAGFCGESERFARDGMMGGSSRGVLRGVPGDEEDLFSVYSCLVPRFADLRDEEDRDDLDEATDDPPDDDLEDLLLEPEWLLLVERRQLPLLLRWR